MVRINRLFTILVLATLILSACQPIQPPEKLLAPAPVGLRPDAPEYAKHGPFWVGYQSLVIDESTVHPLEAGLWYPALNPKGVKEEITYAITLKVSGLEVGVPTVVQGQALRDAAVNGAAAPYPLVVFSHGFATNAAWYSTIIEHYASYGFIVLAPEHVEQLDDAWSEMWRALVESIRTGERHVFADLAGLCAFFQAAIVPPTPPSEAAPRGIRAICD